jgi:hypothetical protein
MSGPSTTQSLRGDELRAVSGWLKERARMKPTGKEFFVSEQRKQLHRSTVNLALQKYSVAASLRCALDSALKPGKHPKLAQFLEYVDLEILLGQDEPDMGL